MRSFIVKSEEKGSPKWKSATSINIFEANTNASFSSSQSSQESKTKSSFLTPSIPYFPTRRGSSPLVAELSALREANQRENKNVVVFPNRKVEDVPGIFIPNKQNSAKPQFLSVENSAKNRRRHSLSDPAIFISKSRPNWLSNLTPRSAYANFTSTDRLR